MYVYRNGHPGLVIRHDRQEPEEYVKYSMHTHTTAELFFFVSGRAVYHIEGNSYQLQPGDMLLMRPAEAHYIDQDPAVPYERICLNFDPTILSAMDPENSLLRAYFDREAGKQNHYRLTGPKATDCRGYLNNILKSQDRLMAVANLILLLQLIGEQFVRSNTQGSQPDTLEYQIVRYINQNLKQELSIGELCNQFFISRAQLCRRFKKITGTSVGKYISAKRLIAAQELLRQGKKPTEVYGACGYQDYSTFYRAYLQYFGHSPRENDRSVTPDKDRMEIV